MQRVTESHVEEAALKWFKELKWAVLHGPDIAPDKPASERKSYLDVILRERLEYAIDSLNPTLPAQAKDDALTGFRKTSPIFHPGPRNLRLHCRPLGGVCCSSWEERMMVITLIVVVP